MEVGDHMLEYSGVTVELKKNMGMFVLDMGMLSLLLEPLPMSMPDISIPEDMSSVVRGGLSYVKRLRARDFDVRSMGVELAAVEVVTSSNGYSYALYKRMTRKSRLFFCRYPVSVTLQVADSI